MEKNGYQPKVEKELKPMKEMKKFEFNLGARVKDRLTNYEGIITARCEYYSRPNSYLVENIDNTGRPIEWWINEDRILIL